MLQSDQGHAFVSEERDVIGQRPLSPSSLKCLIVPSLPPGVPCWTFDICLLDL